MPVISVIVPVYKVEKHIRTCVDSILRQSFQDFEMILVDDGSPDDCPMICDAYAAKDERIRVIHQTNKGLSGARNAGIRESKGKYLCFIDSDDCIASDYLECLYSLISHSDVDFSVVGTRRFVEDEELSKIDDDPQASHDYQIISAGEYFRKQMSPETHMGVWNKLYKREIFDKIAFEEGRLHEDVLLSVGLAKTCKAGAAYCCEPKYYYRINPEGIIGSLQGGCSPDYVYAGNKVIQYGRSQDSKVLEECLVYALEYPWIVIDGIYVHRSFKKNKLLMDMLQKQIRKNINDIMKVEQFSPIKKHRMKLYGKSKFLYGINAYVRLLRVYLYRVLHKDAYKDGHGI